MNTQEVILGMLVERPLSGYDIKQQFETLFSYFFDASFGTIYPTLSKMEKEGLITKESVIQAGKPNKNLFTVTAVGRERFQAYLLSPVEDDAYKSDFLMRLYFGEYVKPDEATNWIRAEIVKTEAVCKRLENDYERFSKFGLTPTQELCIQIGITNNQSKLETLKQGLAKITKSLNS